MPSEDMKPFRSALADAIELLAAKYAMAAKTESPIETIFGAEVARFMGDVLGDNFAVSKIARAADFTLVPQFPLAGFRYDFALCVRGEPYL